MSYLLSNHDVHSSYTYVQYANHVLARTFELGVAQTKSQHACSVDFVAGSHQIITLAVNVSNTHTKMPKYVMYQMHILNLQLKC